jgi:mono/diheme cytochrome c family protein
VKFIAGVVVGVLLVGLGAVIYFMSGMAPVAVAAQAMPFERSLAKLALHARVEKEMPKTVPIAADEAAFLAGAQVYQQHCGICHGLPGMEQGPIGKGMSPKPPHLFRGMGVTDDEPGETYWKVANGIRLTGMPEFKQSLTETQMWQVSLLLANAKKISDTVKQELKPPNPPGGTMPAGGAMPAGAAPPRTMSPNRPGSVPPAPPGPH